MRLKADLLLVLVSLMWGLAFVAQRLVGEKASVYLFNGVRYLLAALVVLPFIPRHRAEERAGMAAQRIWMVAAGVILFIAAAFQQAGLRTTTAGNAGFLTSLYVVFVPFVLFLGWREQPHRLVVAAIGSAAGGAFLLSTSGSFEFREGDLLELAGGLFWAVHVVLVGRFASRYEPISFSAGQLATCGGLNLLWAALARDLPIGEPTHFIGAVLYTAILSLGIGYTIQTWAQRHTPPTDAALILSLEAVFAALAGLLILQEALTRVQALGCGLILAAVLLSQVGARNSGRIAASAPAGMD